MVESDGFPRLHDHILLCELLDMTDRYLPSSPFLLDAIAEKVPLSDDLAAEENLRLLIFATGDQDTTNREWAVYLLAQDAIDTPAVREALQRAAADSDQAVRAEAIFGLARRDTAVALPLVVGELRCDDPLPQIVEAAELCGLPQLTLSQLTLSQLTQTPMGHKRDIPPQDARMPVIPFYTLSPPQFRQRSARG